jgi:hypothetical protein
MSTSDDVVEFTRAWERDGPRVAAYVRRHVAAEDAQDVVAETFLQAWRRWDAVPTQPPIAWLGGAARKVIGNHRRATGRRAALRDRLVLLDAAACSASDAGILATERLAALRRWPDFPTSNARPRRTLALPRRRPPTPGSVLVPACPPNRDSRAGGPPARDCWSRDAAESGPTNQFDFSQQRRRLRREGQRVVLPDQLQRLVRAGQRGRTGA